MYHRRRTIINNSVVGMKKRGENQKLLLRTKHPSGFSGRSRIKIAEPRNEAKQENGKIDGVLEQRRARGGAIIIIKHPNK